MTGKADNFRLVGAMLISQEVSAPLRSSGPSATEFYESNNETSAPVVAKHFFIGLQISPCAMGLAVPVKYTVSHHRILYLILQSTIRIQT
jgi:hypothetical protein